MAICVWVQAWRGRWQCDVSLIETTSSGGRDIETSFGVVSQVWEERSGSD